MILGFTYSLVLDTVDLRVDIIHRNLAVSSEMVLDLANLQDTSFLEGPCSQLLSKLAVGSGGLLAAGSLDSRREPLVLQSLDGAKDGEASRVAGLHSRNNIQLGSSRLNIIGRWDFLLWVIGVGGLRSAKDGRDQRASVTQGLGSNTGKGEDTVAIEQGLDVRTQWSRTVEEEHIVLLGSRDGIVVEVVDNNGGTVIRQVDIDFEKEGADGAGSGGLAREGKDDVAVLVQEVQDVFRGKVGAEAYEIESIDSYIW